MTNKEAMAELKAMPIIYPITNGENDRASRLMQARDMAIKALEQEPCDDAITREDALICLTGEIKETDTIETIIARFVRRIRKLPPVTPQHRTGHWLRIDKDKCKCDQCEVISFIAMYPNGDINYCPNCGCRMVEPQESEKDEHMTADEFAELFTERDKE